MEKTCPRCGKVVVVSAEELAMRNGVAVCPQCLAVFDMDGNVQQPRVNNTARQISDNAPETVSAAPHPAPSQASAAPVTEAFRFCPECGKPLPAGVKFCPYCGLRLAAPAASAPRVQAAMATESPAVADKPAASAPEENERQLPPAAKWAPVFPTVHYRMRKWGAGPASPRAKFVGYTTIFLLLALFAFIVYQGMLISD